MATRKGPGAGRTPRYERHLHAVPDLPKAVEIHKPAMKPPSSVWRHRGKFAAAGLAGTAAAGGGALILTHHNRKEKAVAKSYFNPFDGETYEVSKAGMDNQPTSAVAVPAGLTGAHKLGVKLKTSNSGASERRTVSHHVTNSGASSRRVTSLKAG